MKIGIDVSREFIPTGVRLQIRNGEFGQVGCAEHVNLWVTPNRLEVLSVTPNRSQGVQWMLI
ncbi:MAG: hypothetical protein ACKOEO_23145, partial [Planctomycetaceae bacterium]